MSLLKNNDEPAATIEEAAPMAVARIAARPDPPACRRHSLEAVQRVAEKPFAAARGPLGSRGPLTADVAIRSG